MKIFLTSCPGGHRIIDNVRVPSKLNAENGFVDMLKKLWKEKSKILMIASSPDDGEINDIHKYLFENAFPMSGLNIERFDYCDNRNPDIIDNISEYDVIILSGGHVPTQNKFFEKINLKEKIKEFDGIVIGISAGTMNCAKVVYSQPELDGESIDKDYVRFMTGLGLTQVMVLPHYQYVKDLMLDGKRIMEDITYPDSIGRKFYALPDGSFIYIENGKETLYGEGYLVKDGEITKICESNQSLVLR